jgi:GDP-L-fucose synthase
MYKNESVLVTGGTGFLGKAVVANLKDNGYQNVHAIGSSFDLTTAEDTKLAFDKFEPKAVIHLAATVGGIEANRQNPGLFFYNNLAMGLNTIEQSRLSKVSKFVMAGRHLERISRRNQRTVWDRKKDFISAVGSL